MTKLIWGAPGERPYEYGISHGVLYVGSDSGVAWNGLVSMNETPSGGEPRQYYQDSQNYLNVATREEFRGTLEAFYSPPEFDICDGVVPIQKGLFATQQPRKLFHLSYRTRIGSDTEGGDKGYKIHLIYNALAAPAPRSRNTVTDETGLTSLGWSIVTKPISIPGVAPTAHLIIDSTETYPWIIELIEDVLYGNEAHPPRMPSPEEIVDLFASNPGLIITDHGDGTYTATSLDDSIQMIDETTFQISGDSVLMVADQTYTVSTL